MLTKERLLQTARHECAHGLIAVHFGITVDWLKVSPHRAPHGETALRLPLQPWDVPRRARDDPDGTRRHVTRAVAVLLAPSVLLGTRLDGADLDALDDWRAAWAEARTDTPWYALHQAAKTCVRDWLLNPTVRDDVRRLAGVLAREHFLTGADWRDFVRFLQEERQAPRPAPPRRTPKETVVCSRSFWRDAATGFVVPIFR
jgi:hypothetical protein